MAAIEEEPRRGTVEPEVDEDEEERLKPVVTRRDFLVGAGAGAAAGAAVVGGISLTRPAGPAPARQVAQPPPAESTARREDAPVSTLPPSHRRVTLNINGVDQEVVADVRWSLWEVLTYKLGMGTATNLGCDRSECGACAVVIDGRAVNGCSVLAARLGRGQKITTVEGLARGTDVQSLHPIQRAYHEEQGMQCGVCIRGFIMSTYALLQKEKNPNEAQIREALSGNICRCGSYPEIYAAVSRAAEAMRRA